MLVQLMSHYIKTGCKIHFAAYQAHALYRRKKENRTLGKQTNLKMIIWMDNALLGVVNLSSKSAAIIRTSCQQHENLGEHSSRHMNKQRTRSVNEWSWFEQLLIMIYILVLVLFVPYLWVAHENNLYESTGLKKCDLNADGIRRIVDWWFCFAGSWFSG